MSEISQFFDGSPLIHKVIHKFFDKTALNTAIKYTKCGLKICIFRRVTLNAYCHFEERTRRGNLKNSPLEGRAAAGEARNNVP